LTRDRAHAMSRSPGKRSAPGSGVTAPRVRFAYPGYDNAHAHEINMGSSFRWNDGRRLMP